MPNRLAASTSPYLQQHADNPVDWWEWGPAAFDEAQRRDVPVLVSIGYSACHWCHVMAHESFEDPEVAAMVNAGFVSIKVDREERPDVDSVYMAATTALTGHGGWPMTVFVDHDGRPFFAGTYYPPLPRHGLPSFAQVLAAVSDTWSQRRGDVLAAADRITRALAGRTVEVDSNQGPPTAQDLQLAVTTLSSQFDATHGGFGSAPKFPPSMSLEFLLRHAARAGDYEALTMVEITCTAMARGGIYDQLAGGFARYAVDPTWTVPHFEKMLYDNALLLSVYLHWWRMTRHPLAERIVRETAEFCLRELRTPEGGFASALDADSDGAEGVFYVWTPQQLQEALGDADAAWAADLLAVTAEGTFEHGSSVLTLLRDPDDPARWQRVRSELLASRERRTRPARDDKVVAAWNGLMIGALAEAGRIFDEPDWVRAAEAAADLLLAVHLDDRLLRTSRDGRPGTSAAVLEDYANVAAGFMTLHSVTGGAEWLHLAGGLLDTVLVHFADEAGGFFDTPDDGDPLAWRPRDPADAATPSGWLAAAQALLTYAAHTGSARHRVAAERALAVVTALVTSPRAVGWGLAAAEALLDGPREVAVVGPATDPRTRHLHRVALAAHAPGLVVAVGDPGEPPASPLLADRPLLDGEPAAYVCRGFTCQAPTSQPLQLARELGGSALA